jgi:hypothetical protein
LTREEYDALTFRELRVFTDWMDERLPAGGEG